MKMACEYDHLINEDLEEEEEEEWLNSDEEGRNLIRGVPRSENVNKTLYLYKMTKSLCVVLVWVCLVSVISC